MTVRGGSRGTGRDAHRHEKGCAARRFPPWPVQSSGASINRAWNPPEECLIRHIRSLCRRDKHDLEADDRIAVVRCICVRICRRLEPYAHAAAGVGRDSASTERRRTDPSRLSECRVTRRCNRCTIELCRSCNFTRTRKERCGSFYVRGDQQRRRCGEVCKRRAACPAKPPACYAGRCGSTKSKPAPSC